jgi:iron complex outermembrane receptor protein
MSAWEGAGDTETRKSGNPAVDHIELTLRAKGRFAMSDLGVIFRLLSISVLLLCVSLPVFAETPAELLPETVVSSTRLPAGGQTDIYDTPAKVTVITAEQIRQSGAKTVQEAVQYETGIVSYDQNGNPFQTSIDLRGFSGQPFPATSVFVDGVRVNEPDTNVTNFDLIPLESIERIEIIPGGAAIYGKNALGGVINIITKRGGDQRQATAETMFGSYHRERYAINSSGPIGKFDYMTSFTRETENGYRDESDSRISRYFGKLGFRPTDGTDLTVSYNYTKDRLLQASTLPLDEIAINRQRNNRPGSFQENELNLVSLGGKQKLPLGLSLTVNGFYRHLAGKNLAIFANGAGQSDQLSKTESKGGTAQVTHEVGGNRLANTFTVGTEVTQNDLAARSNGAFFGFPFSSQQSIDEDIFAVFAQNNLEIARTVIVTAGLRYDRDHYNFQNELDPTGSGSRTFTRTTPRAGIVYKLAPKSSLYFNYAEGFRPPNSNEQFALAPFTSNLQLRPVRTRSYEVGSKTAVSDWGEASVALFQTDLRDEIFFTCVLCDFSVGDGTNRNIEKSRRRGVEASARGFITKQWTVSVNYTFTEALFKSPFNLSTTRQVKAGDSVPLVPKHRLGAVIQYRPVPAWMFSVSGLYVSTQFYNNDEANAFPRLPGYFLLGARVSYDRAVPGGKLGVFLQGTNMLGVRYSSYGIMSGAGVRNESPAPEAAVYFGISYRFEGF